MFYQKDSCEIKAQILLSDVTTRVQIKTFVHWINAHLENHHDISPIKDLFVDLRDGKVLLKLLEILSGDNLPSPSNDEMSIHNFENVARSLRYLKLVHKFDLGIIRAEDIVDGNESLTINLIWTIILYFQIHRPMRQKSIGNGNPKQSLLRWCQLRTSHYSNINIRNFTSSWTNGLAFNAIIHSYDANIVPFMTMTEADPIKNLNTAFEIAEREYGVARLLDASDLASGQVDELSMMTYISQLVTLEDHDDIYVALDLPEIEEYSTFSNTSRSLPELPCDKSSNNDSENSGIHGDADTFLKAVRKGNIGVVDILYDDRFKNHVNNFGQSALLEACFKGYVDIVVYLLDREWDIEIQDNNGWRPIHIAANRGYGALLSELITRGCNVFVTDEYGQSALSLAIAANQNECVHILMKYLNIMDKAHEDSKSASSVIKVASMEPKDNTMCPICLSQQKNCALNCGHIFCNQCVSQTVLCFMCRTKITKKLTVYL